MSGASEGVLEALARALQLDDAERAHLFDLARAAQPAGARPRRRQAKPRIRPEIQWTLDAITGAAAYVGNDRLDILATNQLGRALFSELYAAPARPANHARFVFLDPRAEAFYADWDRAARETAAILRSAAGRDPYDRDLSDLVGELATQSEAFRTHWAAHNVRFHATAVKHFHHPVVGELSLSFNRLDIAADHGLTLFTYAAEPGSRSEEALNLLGSWAATADLAEPARPSSRGSLKRFRPSSRRSQVPDPLPITYSGVHQHRSGHVAGRRWSACPPRPPFRAPRPGFHHPAGSAPPPRSSSGRQHSHVVSSTMTSQ